MKKNHYKNLLMHGIAMLPIIIIVALALGAFVYLVASNNGGTNEELNHVINNNNKATEDDINSMTEKDGSMIEGDTMMEGGGDSVMAEGDYNGEVLAGKDSLLLDYVKEDYEKALASDKLIVLYYYANWCPICKNEVMNSLYPAFNELDTDKVVGFRVNYKDSDTDNSEEELAKEFGVAYQHTKVFLKNGKRILKAPDSWSKNRYLEEIANSL